MVTKTILRYPGGKTQLVPLVANMLAGNRSFAEPFAGGAGVGLSLLSLGLIDELCLNDVDPGVYSLWRTVFSDPSELIERIERVPVTVEEWRKQCEIFDAGAPGADLAFSTLFMNRTNFSGILRGRPIGGYDQTGKNKIDCRFNKAKIIEKIKALSALASRVHVSNADGADFIKKLPPSFFLFVDPPYFVQGKSLYDSDFGIDKFEELSDALSYVNNPFLLTLDDVEELHGVFDGKFFTAKYELSYSANNKRKQNEYFVARVPFWRGDEALSLF